MEPQNFKKTFFFLWWKIMLFFSIVLAVIIILFISIFEVKEFIIYLKSFTAILGFGYLMGVFLGIIGANHLQEKVISLRIINAKSFRKWLIETLEKMEYKIEKENVDGYVFRFSGKFKEDNRNAGYNFIKIAKISILAKIQEDGAIIAGPKYFIETLKSKCYANDDICSLFR
jgi:hypothetical protein